MKTIIALLFILSVLISCTKEGEIVGASTREIKINGKEYKFLKVIPEDGAKGVWLLIPKEYDVELPKVTSYEYMKSCGKNCHRKVYVTCLMIS